MAVSDYTPSVEDVAHLIPSRAAARFTGGEGAPAFPDQSRVEAVIQMAAASVAARLGGEALPGKFYDAAKALIVLRTALTLEPAAWPEQTRPDKSAWEQWKQLYDDDMEGLLATVKADAQDGEEGDGGPEFEGMMPSYSFPRAECPVETVEGPWCC